MIFPPRAVSSLTNVNQLISYNNQLQWNPSIKATQDGGLSKEVAGDEG